MAATAPKDYRAEFTELGVERIRRELLMRRWDAEKLAAARLWVETLDAAAWQAGRGDAASDEPDKTWMRRWALYIAVAFGIVYAAVRMSRTLNW